MNQLVLAIALITVALALYSAGFGLSWKRKYPSAFWFFFLGWLLFDVPGTIIMYQIAGKIKFNWHTIPGMIGFVLMALAALLALIQICRFQEKLTTYFRWVENAGYTIWLGSYIIGAIIRH